MRARGIRPSAVTYGVAVSACGNGGQWQRALDLLNRMSESGMTVNVITYNAAIAALATAARNNAAASSSSGDGGGGSVGLDGENLWVRALDLLERMREGGCAPDAYSYSAAISACGSGGRWEESLGLIEAMRGGGIRTRPNRIAYTAAICEPFFCFALAVAAPVVTHTHTPLFLFLRRGGSVSYLTL